MALKALGPMVAPIDLSVAKLPPKTVDPFYRSKQWRDAKARVLKRDHYHCTAPGCARRAVVVDHIVSRRSGGSDDDSNLRSLCRLHDNRIKEGASGERRSGGVL